MPSAEVDPFQPVKVLPEPVLKGFQRDFEGVGILLTEGVEVQSLHESERFGVELRKCYPEP